MQTFRRNPPSPPTAPVTRRHVRTVAAGISLTELLMSITLFSVTLAGAIGAIRAIDNLTTGYVSEGEQREANHADFSNAYNRISQNQDPLPPWRVAQFSPAFVEVPGASNDCPIMAVGSPTSADITAVTGMSLKDAITGYQQPYFGP